MGHAMVGKRNITPWQALLEDVQRTAFELAWLDLKVASAPSDEALLQSGDGGFAPWVRRRDEKQVHMVRVSKMALDAGVAERLVAQMGFEAQEIANAVMTLLNSLHLSEEQWEIARPVWRQQMMALAAREAEKDVVEGSLSDD